MSSRTAPLFATKNAPNLPTGPVAGGGSSRARRTRLPAPWTRTDPPGSPSCHATYDHPSGWRIQHCGHPTAIWPFMLHDPAGQMHLAPHGHCWTHTPLAAAYVAEQLATVAR